MSKKTYREKVLDGMMELKQLLVAMRLLLLRIADTFQELEEEAKKEREL